MYICISVYAQPSLIYTYILYEYALSSAYAYEQVLIVRDVLSVLRNAA